MSTVLQVDKRLSSLIDDIPKLQENLLHKRAAAERIKPENFAAAKTDADRIRELGGNPGIFTTLGWNSKPVQDYVRCCEEADQAALEIPDLARLTQCKAVSDKLICAGFGTEIMHFRSDLTALLAKLSTHLPNAEREIEIRPVAPQN